MALTLFLIHHACLEQSIPISRKRHWDGCETFVLYLAYVARKVSKKTGQVHGRDYEGLLRRVLASGAPYHVEILRRHGRYQVRITVEEAPAPVQTDPRQGWVGVGTNSTFLALCHALPNGNPHAFATIGDPGLYDARATQRDAVVGRLAGETVQWAKDRGAGLVIEDLQFLHMGT